MGCKVADIRRVGALSAAMVADSAPRGVLRLRGFGAELSVAARPTAAVEQLGSTGALEACPP